MLGGGQQLNLSDADWQRRVGVAYERQWRRHFVARLRIAATFAHFAMRPLAAPGLIAAARIWPGLLTIGAGFSGKARSVADPALLARLAHAHGPLRASAAIASHPLAPFENFNQEPA